jgi:choice-of-anchor A domain-containing protein
MRDHRLNALCTAVFIASTPFITPGIANATPLSNSQIFNQFNAVIFNNFSTTSDVEGRTVVGGNLTGGASFNTKPGAAGASAYSGLTVYGSATGGSYNVNNGGGVVVGGNNTASYNLNGGGGVYIGGTNSGTLNGATGSVTVAGANSGTVSLNGGGSVYLGSNSGGVNASGATALSINGNTSNNINLNGGGTVKLNGSNSGTIGLSGGSVLYTGSKGNMNLNGGATATQVGSLTLAPPASSLSSFATLFQNPLTTLSAQLDALAANSTASKTNGVISFNAAPDSTGSAIFDINSSFFSANSSVTMNLNGATSVIINVAVDTCVSTTCAFAVPNSLNFSNPTNYAPEVLWNFFNATSLSFSGEFGGSVLAPFAAVTNRSPIDGTLVAASFSGNGEIHSDPFTGTLPSDPAPVPEPASMAVFGVAMVGLAVARRRKH